MRFSVVFGVTLRLLVINISSSSPAINTAAPAMCHNLWNGGRGPPATVLTTPRMLQREHQALKPDIGSESRFLPTLPAFDAPVRGGGSRLFPYCCTVWHGKTSMVWLRYAMVKKFWWYVYSFWHNSRTWQTDRQTPHDGIGHAYP